MSETSEAMPAGWSMTMGLRALKGEFAGREVILFAVLLRDVVRMSGRFAQFDCATPVLVLEGLLLTIRHDEGLSTKPAIPKLQATAGHLLWSRYEKIAGRRTTYLRRFSARKEAGTRASFGGAIRRYAGFAG
jgi:hypothetical protein